MRRALRVLLLAAGMVAGACGDGADRTEPAAWAGDVCDGFQDYVARVDDLAPRLEAGLDRGAGTEETQRLIGQFLDETEAATRQLRADLLAAGVPDVEGGEAVSEGLVESVDGSLRSVERARAAARALPVDDPEEFEKQVVEVSRVLGQAGAPAPTLGDGGAEIDEVVRRQPACQELGL